MNEEQIQRVYAKLQDDISREVFSYRLLWSLTKDEHFMQQVVQCIEPLYRMKQEMTKGENFLFGAGQRGQRILQFVPHGWSAILDNNPKKWGKKMRRVTIVPPKFIEGHKDARVFVGLQRKDAQETQALEKQLEEFGVSTDRIIYMDGFFQLLARQYFDLPVLRHEVGETFVDAGAFNGGTAKGFAAWAGSYRKIFMFEPDPENLVRCRQVQAELGDEKAQLLPYGLWKDKGELRFDSRADSSCISQEGTIRVPVTSVDEALAGERITFIKMDIEGAELEALHGAEHCIREQHPKLAICVYHKPKDIVEIPAYILSLCGDYKLYLRHYSDWEIETVLYAV